MRQLNYLSILLSIGISLLTNANLYSQSALLQGTISDQNGETLPSATIQIGEHGTIADFDGQYSIELPAGTYQIAVSYLGYETYEAPVVLATGTPTILDIALSETVNLLQTATVTTGKYEKPLSEATVSLEILKSDLVESTNATSIDQALEKIPGVSIVGGQANIRGGSGFSYGAGSRVLVLVNNLPALQADAGTPNWGDLPVENIEQVEVVKGAASALYGSAALNGIFNIRTAYARSEPETKISIFGGIFNAPKDASKKWWADGETKYETGLLFSHRQKINKLDVVLGGRLYTKEDPREGFGNDQGRASVNLRYRVTDQLSIGLNTTYNKQKNRSYFYWLNAQEGIYQGTESNGETRPTRFYIDPFINYYDNKGNRHQFTGRFYSIDNKSLIGDTDNFSDQLYGEYQFQKNIDKWDLVATAGVVGSTTDITAPLYGDTSFVLTNAATYLQLEKKVGDKLNISTGVRYEYNQIDGPELVAGTIIPDGKFEDARPIFRFGLNYQLQEATYLRTSWGQGFRFPTIAEKYITTEAAGFPIFPNPELASETGWSAEIGIKQGFRVRNWQGYLDVAAFQMEYENMIEYAVSATVIDGIPQVGFQAQNIGNTIIKGLDFSLVGEGKLGNIPLAILAGYTYIDPKFQEFTDGIQARSSVDFNILKYRFQHSVKVDIETGFNKFKIGIALLRNSNMEAIDALFEDFVIPGLKEYRAANNEGYYVWNVRMSYQLSSPLKASLIVNNLTNEEYSNRPGLLEPTRLISARLDYVF